MTLTHDEVNDLYKKVILDKQAVTLPSLEILGESRELITVIMSPLFKVIDPMYRIIQPREVESNKTYYNYLTHHMLFGIRGLPQGARLTIAVGNKISVQNCVSSGPDHLIPACRDGSALPVGFMPYNDVSFKVWTEGYTHTLNVEMVYYWLPSAAKPSMELIFKNKALMIRGRTSLRQTIDRAYIIQDGIMQECRAMQGGLVAVPGLPDGLVLERSRPPSRKKEVICFADELWGMLMTSINDGTRLDTLEVFDCNWDNPWWEGDVGIETRNPTDPEATE